MGAIDKTDMLLCSTECVRRTLKWYKKLFFHLINMSMLNTYSTCKTVTGKHVSLANFQLILVNEILQKYKTNIKTSPSKGEKRNTSFMSNDRLNDKHLQDLIVQTSTRKTKKKMLCLQS